MKIYQFFLKASDTEYYIVNNGIVSMTTEAFPLPHACLNWDALEVNYNRNIKYWGVFREFSTELQFTKDAATVLRNVIYTQGVDGVCTLELRVLNTFNLSYEIFVQASLDFSQASDERDYVSINIMEKGLVESLKSQETVSQEISLNQPESLNILMGGTRLGVSSRWILGVQPPDPIGIDGVYHGYGYGIPSSSTSDIQPGSFFVPFDAGFNGPTGSALTSLIPSFYGRMQRDWYNIKYSGNLQMFFQWSVNSGTASLMRIEVYARYYSVSGGTINNQILIGQTANMPVGSYDLNIPLSGNIASLPVASGTLSFFMRFVVAAGSTSSNLGITTQFKNDNTYFQINYQASVDPSNAKALRYYDYATKMAQKLGADGVLSSFLTNTATSNAIRALNMGNSAWNTTVFSGDSARQNPNAVIKSDFEEMGHDFFSRWAGGIGVEGNSFRMEPITYFLQDVEIFRIEQHKNFRCNPIKDYIFNDILVGCDPQDTENVVGKNEFNTTMEFLIENIKSVPKQDDAKTTYIEGVYAIETGRAVTFDQSKQDNKFDNKTMILEVDPIPVAGQFKPFRPVGQVIQGVDDPAGVYNIYISPASKFVRHMGRLKAFCETGYARYKTTDKNSELISTFVNGTLVEKADKPLSVNTYQNYDVSRWFQAFAYELDCKMGIELYNAIKNNPYGYITVVENGEEYRGHVLESKFNIAKENPNALKLLAHKNDDLTRLIR